MASAAVTRLSTRVGGRPRSTRHVNKLFPLFDQIAQRWSIFPRERQRRVDEERARGVREVDEGKAKRSTASKVGQSICSVSYVSESESAASQKQKQRSSLCVPEDSFLCVTAATIQAGSTEHRPQQQQQPAEGRVCVVRSPHQTAAILTCSRLWFGGKVFSLDVPWPICRPGVAPGGPGPGSIDARHRPRPFKASSGGRSGSEIAEKSRSKFCTKIFFSSTLDRHHCLCCASAHRCRANIGPLPSTATERNTTKAAAAAQKSKSSRESSAF